VNRYVGLVLERQGRESPHEDKRLGGTFRHGDGASRVIDRELLDARGEKTRERRFGRADHGARARAG
jgi:hypothetical protein